MKESIAKQNQVQAASWCWSGRSAVLIYSYIATTLSPMQTYKSYLNQAIIVVLYIVHVTYSDKNVVMIF